MLLSNQWVTEEKGNLKIPGDRNGNVTIQNLWSTAKPVLRRRLMAYLMEQEKFQPTIGRADAEAETPILWPPDAKN